MAPSTSAYECGWNFTSSGSKSHIGLAVCQDRKWKNYTVENAFAAVEQVNTILLEKAQRRRLVQDQLDMMGGAQIQLD